MWIGFFLAGVLVGLFSPEARAAGIPHEAVRYQRDLVRSARLVWGLDAPVATFAGQIHQESRWNETAKSAVGASGLAQFMPSTAAWINGAYPALRNIPPPRETSTPSGTSVPLQANGLGLGGVMENPVWAMRALVTYDKHLYDRVKGSTPCERMAKALSAYNGGLGWVYRDEKLAAANGFDPLKWFGSVERFNAGRKPIYWQENRGYPRFILTRWEPMYIDAGWGLGVCA